MLSLGHNALNPLYKALSVEPLAIWVIDEVYAVYDVYIVLFCCGYIGL